MKTFSAVIIEDHPLVREGLKHLLELNNMFSVCGEANDYDSAINLIAAKQPRLAIVDLTLRDISGLEIIKRINLEGWQCSSIIVSMHNEKIYAERAIKAGAKGYVMKNENIEQLLKAFKTVAEGGIYLSESVKEDILANQLSGRQDRGDHVIGQLSNRELEVFQLIGRGKRNQEIADLLNVSIKTVESHRENIKNKMKIKHANELQCLAVQWLQIQ